MDRAVRGQRSPGQSVQKKNPINAVTFSRRRRTGHGDLPLEQQQHGVHDPHDEVRGLLQLPDCGDVGRLDGLTQEKKKQ